jgi:hypothetical protein
MARYPGRQSQRPPPHDVDRSAASKEPHTHARRINTHRDYSDLLERVAQGITFEQAYHHERSRGIQESRPLGPLRDRRTGH